MNASLAEVTRHVENIRWNDDTLAATLALTEEEAEKIIMKFEWSRWDH